jgi:hypothetical protein
MLALISLAVSALLALTLTRDKATRVDILQLSSKCGRRIYQKQLLAMLISAFAIITLMLALFMSILVVRLKLDILWNNPLNSFMDWYRGDVLIPGVSLALGQYLLIIIGFAYALGIGLTLALFYLSGKSGNYISLLAKAIPAFIIVGVFCGAMLARNGLFSFSPFNPYRIFLGEALFEPIVPAVILVAGTAMTWWFLRSRRRAEV